MTCSPLRIGFVSFGQGPRGDLEDLHRRLFAAHGLAPDVRWFHLLDGIPDTKLALLKADDTEPAIRALHGAVDASGLPSCKSWLSRSALSARIPVAIAELEHQGVDLIILCAAEMLPEYEARAACPVIFPAEVMFAMARDQLRADPSSEFGLVVYGDRQRRQQIEGWRARREGRTAPLHFSGKGADAEAAVQEFASCELSMVFLWAYGAATAAGASERMSAQLDVPVVSAAAAAVCEAVRVLRPRQDF